ncbi:MAG: trypsin-like peptidase domain-containing protein [Rhodobacteraceae bacterium]|nr:trypsin-like peptidase domain-containing protein [Paracoccaceae bacterium]
MLFLLRRALIVICLTAGTFTSASAQDTWVQVEALPSLGEGEVRARAYSGVFTNVAGFRMTTGWYAIALGPFPAEEAVRQLSLLKGERMIPDDSYIATGENYRQRFWPVGLPATAVETAPATAPETPQPASQPATPAPVDTETPAEARRAEALLSGEERMLVQEALQWNGFYTAAIDGAFGPGTRNSMSDWQAAMGYETTGILTTYQRGRLIEDYEAERAALGLQQIAESEAGIEITLPMALVAFDRYEPPFVHFKEKDGSGFRALLISQQGEQSTLFGLYDILQTLEIVPLEGDRNLGRTSFEITGRNDRIQSYTYAALQGGLIKGFTLVWPRAEDDRARRVVDAMKASFRPIGDQALNDGLGVALSENHADILAGLEVRKPTISRSGFFIDPLGTVVTTSEVLNQCGRITIDGAEEVDVTLQDDALGLAVLKPRAALAPRGHADLRTTPARINSEVAVAGYSYEDALTEPVMTFGMLADLKGLNGEADLARLSLTALPGDAGGPVLDTSGKVMGMLLPRRNADGRVLPADVGFALRADVIATALAERGVVLAQQASTGDVVAGGALAAEDLTRIGMDMTVLVSCWQ